MLFRFKYLIITVLFCLPPLGVLFVTSPAASQYHVHSEAGTYTEVNPTKMPVLTSTATHTATPVPTNTQVEIRYWRVGNTDGDGVYIRKSPGSEELIEAWPDTTLMVRIGPDVTLDGKIWRHVRDPKYQQGYVRAVHLVAAANQTPPTRVRVKRPPSTPVVYKTATGSPSGTEAQDLAIQAIKQESLVRDAAIRRDGDTFHLVLVVNAGTNETEARRLGENFVRLLKTYSDDTNPGQDIGTGKYHYIIGVYYPDRSEVAFGAKSSITPWITWN